MNILMITNILNTGFEEDLIICKKLELAWYKVYITNIFFDEKLDDFFDLFIIRNSYFEDKNMLKKYVNKSKEVIDRINKKGKKWINFSWKFDSNWKQYLVDLFKKWYPVIPSIESIENINILPDTDFYIMKDKNSYDWFLQEKITKKDLKKSFKRWNIIQPCLKFISEVQFYFINNTFQYALEFSPSKVPIYPRAKKYKYLKKELKIAQTFADLNNDLIWIQRIDFLKIKNWDLYLIEIEDCSPYIDLDCLRKKEQDKFIENYISMVNLYLEK